MLTSNRKLADLVHTRLEAAETMASDLLTQHKDILVQLAKRLVNTKVLDGDEVQDLIGENMQTGIP